MAQVWAMASCKRSSRTSSGRKRATGLKIPQRILLSNSLWRLVGMVIVTVVLQGSAHTMVHGRRDAQKCAPRGAVDGFNGCEDFSSLLLSLWTRTLCARAA